MRTVEIGSDGDFETAQEGLSHLLFKGGFRIDVGAAIARSSEIFCQNDLVLERATRQSVHKELETLLSAGLIARAPRDRGRQIYYLRQESLYWALCSELYENADLMLRRAAPTWLAGGRTSKSR